MNMTKSKMSVIIIAILFIGSSIGMALLYNPSTPKIKIPDKFVNKEDLNEETKDYLLEQGVYLLYIYHSPNCVDCYTILEKMSSELYDLSGYLYIFYLPSNITKIVLVSKNNETVINQGSADTILDIVCNNNIISKKCVEYLAGK